jgi:hypothetical protein
MCTWLALPPYACPTHTHTLTYALIAHIHTRTYTLLPTTEPLPTSWLPKMSAVCARQGQACCKALPPLCCYCCCHPFPLGPLLRCRRCCCNLISPSECFRSEQGRLRRLWDSLKKKRRSDASGQRWRLLQCLSRTD